jgi:hypothetical protein
MWQQRVPRSARQHPTGPSAVYSGDLCEKSDEQGVLVSGEKVGQRSCLSVLTRLWNADAALVCLLLNPVSLLMHHET